ncbi:MAG: bifunctional UDP-N-acetylglucosamine diphosphorylase/glucosamine-1-phosphate N-acetyltransferase GlmU [Firmicutes bacterium]|nr:bifunctional UDP-N-acetylglucosamine diphosphorylase/glucosamine-1-phosphate N-acetyltransferase GlmU [Bacillota bacterium]
MSKPWAVILAAGEGKRMKSKLPKVLHRLCGREMINHVLENVSPLTEKQIIVVGHGAHKVRETLGEDYLYAYQKEQLGTGHALLQALPLLPEEGSIFVLCGDTPLLATETLQDMWRSSQGMAATVLTAVVGEPSGYGRIIREGGLLRAIVEERDASAAQKEINEINAGAYIFKVKILKRYLAALSNDNAQGEYYLTDIISALVRDRYPVNAFKTPDSSDVLGINDRCQLAEVTKIMRERLNKRIMREGVTLIDPETTYIDVQARFKPDTLIYPQTVIEGECIIGEGCVIGPNCHLQKVKVGDYSTITESVIIESEVGCGATIGPFAYIRPQSIIGDRVKIGDFVEIKKSVIGEGTKIPHLSYVGDAEIKEGVNIGAGTITVNYDGKRKFRTTIEKNAFIGCNSNLVAPVKIGEGAYVGAGSTITEDVPADALAIARQRQVNKEGLAKKFRNKKEE